MNESVHAVSALPLSRDDAVYDQIEALLAADLTQRDRSELVRVLEGVAVLLSAERSDCTESDGSESDGSESDGSESDGSESEFSDPSVRVFPMGQESSTH
jgi:hypothetical protein